MAGSDLAYSSARLPFGENVMPVGLSASSLWNEAPSRQVFWNHDSVSACTIGGGRGIWLYLHLGSIFCWPSWFLTLSLGEVVVWWPSEYDMRRVDWVTYLSLHVCECETSGDAMQTFCRNARAGHLYGLFDGNGVVRLPSQVRRCGLRAGGC